jgi:deoxycytidine triphosphate deaminase
MSVLSDRSLRAMYPDREPGPASIDLHLGDSLLYWPEWNIRDPRVDQSRHWKAAELHEDVSGAPYWLLKPGLRYLASTVERIEIRPDCAGQIGARSSWGRDGLAVICGPAGWLDPGYTGNPTLELSVVGSELVLWPGAAVCQLIVFRLTTVCERPYQGKYAGDQAPTPSRLFREARP